MKALLILAALMADPQMQGGNNGGVGEDLRPVDVVIAYANGVPIEVPGFGSVHIRNVDLDTAGCTLRFLMEDDEGAMAESALTYCCEHGAR